MKDDGLFVWMKRIWHLIIKGLRLGELRETLSKLPYRCVTLRDYYYQYDKGDKRKVLVTLYKPYRTRLWSYGEYKTMVMLNNGSICTVSPDEIEEIVSEESKKKNNKN
jgi:hypothetical protein